MIERQQINERTEAQMARALRDGGEKDPRRSGDAERRRVMFGEVVGVDARAIISLDQAQPVLVMLAERQTRMVQMIEYAELHWFPPRRLRSVSETRWAKATGGL